MNHKVHEDHEAHKDYIDITPEIIRLGIKVHRTLGPGLLEDVYEECLCWEFSQNRLAFSRQIDLPLFYEGVRLRRAYRADIVVVPTFGGWFQQTQILRCPEVLESAKLG